MGLSSDLRVAGNGDDGAAGAVFGYQVGRSAAGRDDEDGRSQSLSGSFDSSYSNAVSRIDGWHYLKNTVQYNNTDTVLPT